MGKPRRWNRGQCKQTRWKTPNRIRSCESRTELWRRQVYHRIPGGWNSELYSVKSMLETSPLVGRGTTIVVVGVCSEHPNTPLSYGHPPTSGGIAKAPEFDARLLVVPPLVGRYGVAEGGMLKNSYLFPIYGRNPAPI
jgi:hypothetical protein